VSIYLVFALLGVGQAALAEDSGVPTEVILLESAPAVESAANEGFDELTADMESLRADLRKQQALLDEQAATIERMNGDLLETRLKLIPKDEFHVELEGYYRTRAYVFANLFNTSDSERDARYMEHALRLRPSFNYKDLAKLILQVDALPGVVWGDNESLSTTAVFAGDPSSTGIGGAGVPTILLSRAWTEFSVPVGSIRIGRMPSHWGMGLLANDGNGFRNTFGEARNGNTFDRALFATKPIALAQAIMGKDGKDIPLILAVGIDRLVEDPLIQFKGYTCEPDIYDDDPDYDERCDVNGDGRTDQDHGYTDESYTTDHRGQDWWADQDDDVMEMIYVLIYKGEQLSLFGLHGDLTAGGYVIHRIQNETDSNVIIVDGYLNFLMNGIAAEAEIVTIKGTTRGITLPGAFNLDPDADPLQKNAAVTGYVTRLGYVRPGWKIMMEHGYASGDENVADAEFTGRSLHADHNVGLLLYEEVLARVTSQVWTESGEGLWSNGGVYNSHYIFPTVTLNPMDNWELIGGFLVAWPDKPDGAIIACIEGEGCSQVLSTSEALGWEADFGIHHNWHKHLQLALEMGYAHVTDRLPLEAAGLNPEGNFFTFQTRLAWQF
jgi:hypothetical protein